MLLPLLLSTPKPTGLEINITMIYARSAVHCLVTVSRWASPFILSVALMLFYQLAVDAMS